MKELLLPTTPIQIQHKTQPTCSLALTLGALAFPCPFYWTLKAYRRWQYILILLKYHTYNSFPCLLLWTLFLHQRWKLFLSFWGTKTEASLHQEKRTCASLRVDLYSKLLPTKRYWPSHPFGRNWRFEPCDTKRCWPSHPFGWVVLFVIPFNQKKLAFASLRVSCSLWTLLHQEKMAFASLRRGLALETNWNQEKPAFTSLQKGFQQREKRKRKTAPNPALKLTAGLLADATPPVG